MAKLLYVRCFAVDLKSFLCKANLHSYAGQ